MNTILRVAFNNPRLNELLIDNPGHLPVSGEVFSCKWDDFIEDKEQLLLLEELEKEECFMVERFSSKFSKEETECMIILYLSNNFPKNTLL